MENVEWGLWVALMVAQSLLLLNLIREKLYRRYPFFVSYLAMDLIAGLVLIQIPFHSIAYSRAFRVYGITIAILRLGVAWELYERICEHFSGIGKFRFRLAASLGVLTIIATICTFTPEIGAQWGFPHTIATVLRRFQGELAGGMLLSLWLFLRYVLHIQPALRPSVSSHWRILTVYFLATAVHAIAVLASGGGRKVHALNTALMLVDLGCVFAWIKTMNAKSDRLPERVYLSQLEIETMEKQNRELMETLRWLRN